MQSKLLIVSSNRLLHTILPFFFKSAITILGWVFEVDFFTGLREDSISSLGGAVISALKREVLEFRSKGIAQYLHIPSRLFHRWSKMNRMKRTRSSSETCFPEPFLGLVYFLPKSKLTRRLMRLKQFSYWCIQCNQRQCTDSLPTCSLNLLTSGICRLLTAGELFALKLNNLCIFWVVYRVVLMEYWNIL